MKYSIITFLAIVFCTSCTGMLWDRNEYTENIHSLYIDDENNSFVVMGESYHYIFKSEKKLLNILKASKEIKINPLFYYFDLSSDNTVSGKFDLFAYKNETSDSDVIQLKKLGFDDSDSYNNEMLWYKTYIEGVRYKTDSNISYGKNLRKKYSIKVLEPRTDSAAEITGKILATPITVSADVVLGVAGGVLYGLTFK